MALGIVLGVAAALIILLRLVWQSKAEWARRLRIVIYSLVGILVAIIVVEEQAVGAFAVLAAIIGALAWVYKGYKNKG